MKFPSLPGPSRKFLEEGHWRCKVAGATAAAGSKQEELSAILEVACRSFEYPAERPKPECGSPGQNLSIQS